MEKCIKLAIEGGWDKNRMRVEEYDEWDKALIDPLFWQALGKNLKWGTYNTGILTPSGNNIVGEVCLMQWHNFIEHLWKGKDAESFFENLLNNK